MIRQNRENRFEREESGARSPRGSRQRAQNHTLSDAQRRWDWEEDEERPGTTRGERASGHHAERGSPRD